MVMKMMRAAGYDNDDDTDEANDDDDDGAGEAESAQLAKLCCTGQLI